MALHLKRIGGGLMTRLLMHEHLIPSIHHHRSEGRRINRLLTDRINYEEDVRLNLPYVTPPPITTKWREYKQQQFNNFQEDKQALEDEIKDFYKLCQSEFKGTPEEYERNFVIFRNTVHQLRAATCPSEKAKLQQLLESIVDLKGPRGGFCMMEIEPPGPVKWNVPDVLPIEMWEQKQKQQIKKFQEETHDRLNGEETGGGFIVERNLPHDDCDLSLAEWSRLKQRIYYHGI